MVGSCGPALTLVDPAAATDAVLSGGAAATLGGTPNIGVVCEVRLHRGGRQLTVKSSVEVVNLTDETLVMCMPSPDATAAIIAARG